jgi:hypothetical protein
MGFLSDVAGSLTGGLIGTDAASDAAKTSAKGAEAGIAEQRRQFDTTLQLQAPMINTGNAARSLLASIMGLDVAGSEFTVGGTTKTTYPQPTGGINRFMGRPVNQGQPTTTTTGGTTFTNPAASPMGADEITKRLEAFPGYQFAVDQARKNTLATASALGSGGGNVLTAISDRTAQGIAMPTFENYLNRLGGLSGSGQNASNAAGTAALNTGQNVAAGLQNAADSRASGILGRNQSIGSALSSIGGMVAGGMGGFGGMGAAAGNAAAPVSTAHLPWLLGNPLGGP